MAHNVSISCLTSAISAISWRGSAMAVLVPNTHSGVNKQQMSCRL